MPPITINLTSLAVILWSGMLVIAGSIWILASQVRKLADLVEEQGKLELRRTTEQSRTIPESRGELPRERILRMVEGSTSRAN